MHTMGQLCVGCTAPAPAHIAAFQAAIGRLLDQGVIHGKMTEEPVSVRLAVDDEDEMRPRCALIACLHMWPLANGELDLSFGRGAEGFLPTGEFLRAFDAMAGVPGAFYLEGDLPAVWPGVAPGPETIPPMRTYDEYGVWALAQKDLRVRYVMRRLADHALAGRFSITAQATMNGWHDPDRDFERAADDTIARFRRREETC